MRVDEGGDLVLRRIRFVADEQGAAGVLAGEFVDERGVVRAAGEAAEIDGEVDE